MKRINTVSVILIICVYAVALRACMNVIQADAQVIDHGSFVVDFNPKTGCPNMVSWAITPDDLGNQKREPSFRFKADKATPKPRVTSALYTRSGFQRGHMCPAADRSASREAMRSTFVMSNVCPQTSSLNTGAWKSIENLERKIALATGRCSVHAAPLFFPQDTTWIGGHRVAVPHAFVKVLFNSKPDRWYGVYILENK